MRETDPILLHPRPVGAARSGAARPVSGQPAATTGVHPEPRAVPVTVFTRAELSDIFAVYGRMVAAGEWRDYALDMGVDKAVFSIFRRASECPLYRVEKVPRLARKQGAFSVVGASGQVLKRGAELPRVLAVLDKRLRLVER